MKKLNDTDLKSIATQYAYDNILSMEQLAKNYDCSISTISLAIHKAIVFRYSRP